MYDYWVPGPLGEFQPARDGDSPNLEFGLTLVFSPRRVVSAAPSKGGAYESVLRFSGL